jgi:hypothetical protein
MACCAAIDAGRRWLPELRVGRTERCDQFAALKLKRGTIASAYRVQASTVSTLILR